MIMELNWSERSSFITSEFYNFEHKYRISSQNRGDFQQNNQRRDRDEVGKPNYWKNFNNRKVQHILKKKRVYWGTAHCSIFLPVTFLLGFPSEYFLCAWIVPHRADSYKKINLIHTIEGKNKRGTYHSNNNNKIIPVLLIWKLNCKTVLSILILNISRYIKSELHTQNNIMLSWQEACKMNMRI